MIIPTFQIGFGGEPIESRDGESLEGVGETRFTTGTMYTDKLFTRWVEYAVGAIETGQRDVGLGIYHYGARFYSPYLNHFTQPDSIVPDPYNPQDWNRYSYARNNPVRYTDPSGHTSVCAGSNGDPECYNPAPTWMPSLSQMGITIDERWTSLDVGTIQKEASAAIPYSWQIYPLTK